jgi:serine/threonine protein phosphatase 1
MRLLDRLFSRPPISSGFDNHLRLEQWPEAIYAIGDVHGCLDALRELERIIEADAVQFPGAKVIVMLGDYVDRGPSSAMVIAHLLGDPPAGFSRIALAGNHEEMMLNALKGSDERDWLALGGTETLRSYGIDPDLFASASRRTRRDIVSSHFPVDHFDFIENLALSLQVHQTVFVHAGIRRGIPVDQQDRADLLWMRPGAHQEPADGLLVVHGHTPVQDVQVRSESIAVDTGAFATGRLSAVRLAPNLAPKIFTTTA